MQLGWKALRLGIVSIVIGLVIIFAYIIVRFTTVFMRHICHAKKEQIDGKTSAILACLQPVA